MGIKILQGDNDYDFFNHNKKQGKITGGQSDMWRVILGFPTRHKTVWAERGVEFVSKAGIDPFGQRYRMGQRYVVWKY